MYFIQLIILSTVSTLTLSATNSLKTNYPKDYLSIVTTSPLENYEIIKKYINQLQPIKYVEQITSDEYEKLTNEALQASKQFILDPSISSYHPQSTHFIKYDESDNEANYLIAMKPPSVTDNYINYYEIGEKPKKGTKKYSPNSKHINYRDQQQQQQQQYQQIEPIRAATNTDRDNNQYQFEDINAYYPDEVAEITYYDDNRQRIAPLTSLLKSIRRDEPLNTGEYIPAVQPSTTDDEKLEEKPKTDSNNKNIETTNNTDDNGSEGGERVHFQMHGYDGPNSYKFGYDTGKGKNRQFRVENRDNNGDVEGQYGYFDRNGKLRITKYSSRKNEGFQSKEILS